MVTVEQAREIVLGTVKPLPAEFVPLGEALGRIVAEDVIADADLVPYARSAMDGYAVRAVDTLTASPERPASLPVAGKVLAGAGEATLTVGTAIAVTTGAPLPDGADAVVPHEQVRATDNRILISSPVVSGGCIFPPAEDVRRGEILVHGGDVLRPAILALLAFIGRPRIQVYGRPRVTVVSTGNELVDVAATPGHGQVRNSNAFALMALITECGAHARICGIVPDNREALRSMLQAARRRADLLITTGGASVGERDLVKAVLEDLGTEFRFRGVAVRPGKPTGFGIWNSLPVCVLPGNPAAAFVTFHEFVRPALLRLAGRQVTVLPTIRATLRGRLKSKPGHQYIILARLAAVSTGFEVTPLANQCSVLVRTAAEANALIVLPQGPGIFATGDRVEVQVLDWDRVVGGRQP